MQEIVDSYPIRLIFLFKLIKYILFFFMQSFAEKHFNENDWKTLVDNEEFNNEVLKEVQDACKKGGIEKFETPQRIKIVTDSWTPETGLVTDALKLKRKAIEQKYKDDIEQLYENKPKNDSTNNSNKDQSNEKKDDSKENPTEVGEDAVDNKKDQ